jgi:hypothetical protein
MKKILYLLLLIPAFASAQYIERKPTNPVISSQLNYLNGYDYGMDTAKADNVTAINAMLAAARRTHTPPIIPVGTFYSSAFTLPDSVKLYGVDTTSVLKRKSGAPTFVPFITTGNDNLIRDLKIDGNPANGSASSDIIFMSGKKNLTMNNVLLVNSPSATLTTSKSVGVNLRNIYIDSAGTYGLNFTNTNDVTGEYIHIRGWDRLGGGHTSIAISASSVDSAKNYYWRKVLTENKLKSSNFSFESAGSVKNATNVTIENSTFRTHNVGGAGISLAVDSLKVYNCRFEFDSIYLAIECAGNSHLFDHNYFMNGSIRDGTHLYGVSKDVTVSNNEFNMTDSSTGYDGVVAFGGYSSAALDDSATYENYNLVNNTFHLEKGKQVSVMFAGYYAGGRGFLKRLTIAHNTIFARPNSLAFYFTGAGGSQIDAHGNKMFVTNGNMFLRDNGIYTASTFYDNQYFGGTIFTTGMNTTNFPNWLVYNNVTDSTAAYPYATTASPTFTGTVTVPNSSIDDNSTRAANTAYVDRQAGQYTSFIATGTSTTLLQQHSDFVLFTNTTVLATHTVVFPASPVNNDEIIITGGGTITYGSPLVTLFAINTNGQGLMGAAPSTLNAGDVVMYKFGNGIWFRIKL